LLDYIDEEVAEVIVNDVIDFYNTYIAMKSLTMESFDVENFDNRTINIYIHNNVSWNGYRYPSARIMRESRTRVRFNFIFKVEELEWAMKLYHMLDGYIYVKLTNTNEINVSFSLDLGSKQGCLDYFNNLQT
jgi:hypothetical protein